MTTRRTFLSIMALAGCAPWAARSQMAYPDRPVTMVVPNPPGGASDLMARLIGSNLGQWMHPVVVENRPGAGGSIGSQYVADSAPDGHTLLMGGIASHAINPALYKSIKYDPVKSFTALTLVGTLSNVLLVHPSFPANSLQEMIDLARSSPGKYAYASVGNGTSPHLSGELFCQMAGLDLMHVPYKGSAAALNDLLGGQILIAFDNLSAGLPFVKEGKLRALAVTTKERSSLLPEVPTLDEAGVSGYEITSWAGLFAPAGLSNELARRISSDVGTVLRREDVVKRLLALGVTTQPMTPEAFAAFVESEVAKYRTLADKANIQLG